MQTQSVIHSPGSRLWLPGGRRKGRIVRAAPSMVGNAVSPAARRRGDEVTPVTIFGANLIMWLRADQFDGTTWTDQSSRGEHWTEATNPPSLVASNAAFNNKPTVSFGGTNEFLAPSTSFASPASSEITLWGIWAVDNDPGTSLPATRGAPISQWGSWSGGTTSNFYPFTNGTCYMGPGSTGRKTLVDPVTSALDVMHLCKFISKAGEFTFAINGTQESTTGSNSFGWQTTNPYIGRDDLSTSDHYYQGDISEIVMIDTASPTAAQKTAFINYVNARYDTSWATHTTV